MARRHYLNGAASTSTTASIAPSDTTFSVADLSSYPASVPYTIAIDSDNSSFEVILVTDASANTINNCTRGYDGTAAQSHASNALVQHVAVSMDYDEANAHVNATTDVHGVTGALVGATSTQTLTNKTLTNPTITGGAHTGATTLTATGAVEGNTVSSTNGAITANGGNLVTDSDVVATGAVLASTGSSCQVRFDSCSAPSGGAVAFTSGFAEFNTLGVSPDGTPSGRIDTITIPAGKGGRYKISGQVTVTDVTHRVQAWITKNASTANDTSSAIIQELVGPAGGGTFGVSVAFPEREYTLAAGDKLRIVASVIGATAWTSTSSNGFDTFLRVERVG